MFVAGVQSGAQAALMCPLHIPSVLIQLGYEPREEILSRDFFGRQVFRRVGLIDFVAIIYKRDGILGLYRGATMRFADVMVEDVARRVIRETLRPSLAPSQDKKRSELATLAQTLAFDSLVNSLALVFSHPLHLLSLRMIAQYANKTPVYESALEAATHVVTKEGLGGLYAGFLPHVLTEIAYVVSFGALTYALNKLEFPSEEMLGMQDADRRKQASVVGFFRHSLASPLALYVFYPFKLATILAAVTQDTQLVVSHAPWNPHLPSWTDTLARLFALDGFGPRGLLRGSSNFFRTYTRHIPIHTTY